MDSRAGNSDRPGALSGAFDAVDMLGHSHARHVKSSRLADGIALAEWQNRRGRVRYQAPHHHTLSYYMLGGDHLRRVNPGNVGLGHGMFSLLPAGHHSEWALSGDLRFIHIYLDPVCLNEFAAAVTGRHGTSIQLPEAAFAEDPYMDQLIRFLLCPLDWNDNADRMALSRVVDLVMLQLIKHYDARRPRLVPWHYSLAPAVERRVRDYIESNLDQPLTLSELAGVAGLSRYHFARMFKQSNGVTAHAYVVARRIARARTLLCQSTLPIADIADCCGFSSQGHFSNRFKTATGVTPSRYRAG